MLLINRAPCKPGVNPLVDRGENPGVNPEVNPGVNPGEILEKSWSKSWGNPGVILE